MYLKFKNDLLQMYTIYKLVSVSSEPKAICFA